MKKIVVGLLLSMTFFSCSKDESKTQDQIASRPTVPINASEVRIGTQIWMTKNLNVSRYRNGDPIPQVQDPTAWANPGGGAWCYFENNTANGTVYGKLYNWYAVNDPRGLAPTGYHVPSKFEWTILTTFLAGGINDVEGNKMKATTLWLPYPGIINTNSSGFTGLPGGGRYYSMASFYGFGKFGYWWSSSEWGINKAWVNRLNYNDGSITNIAAYNYYGYSVRCIRD